MTELHYGDLRARATAWWALQRARVRLTQAVGAAKKAGWGTTDDHLSLGMKALAVHERAAARATVEACAAVYPTVAELVSETHGLGDAIAMFLGLVPPLMRLEEFPGFPCPTALWSYCGLVAEKRAKFDRRARMIAIAYIGLPAIMRAGIYHDLYAERRERTADREWTKMHSHRDGIRYVAKRILRDVWQRRLPVGSTLQPLQPEGDVTAVGALASESFGQPIEEISPATALSAPELDARPEMALSPVPTVSAPESDLLPKDGLVSILLLSAPESAARPVGRVSPVVQLGTPEPVGSPKLLLPSIHDVTAPGSA